MAGILSELTERMQGAKQGAKEGAKQGAKESFAAFESGKGTPTGGLIGSVFRGTVGGLFYGAATKGKATDSSNTQAPDAVAQGLQGLLPYFANITENIQLIAYHMGASITVMKDVRDDAKASKDKAVRAKEEADTEDAGTLDGDAIKAPPPESESDAEKCDCEEEPESSEGKEAAGKFAGLDLEGIVTSFGSMIGSGLINLGVQGLTKLFPVTLVASLVAAIGYGIYKYFTDDEFKKSVDDAFSTAKQFVVKEVFTPFIDSVKRLISGAIDFMGKVWEWVTGIVDKGAAWIADKLGIDYEGAKKAVKETATKAKEGAKKVAGAVVGFFTGKKEAPPPAPAAAPSPSPTPTQSSKTSSAPPSAPPPPGEGSSAAPPPAATPEQATPATPAPANVDKDAAPTTGAPQGDAGKFESLVKKADPGVVLSGFHDTFKARLAGLAEEFEKLTGKKMTITSGFRTREKQEQLYKEKNGVGVAKPGTSLHESGVAIDIQKEDANKAASLGLLDKYRLIRPLLNWSVKPEPWHVEPVERKGLKTTPDGNFVAGGNGKATTPDSGKVVPSDPNTGAELAASSTSNAAANEARAKNNGTTIIVNNQKNINNQNQVVNMNGGGSSNQTRVPATIGA